MGNFEILAKSLLSSLSWTNTTKDSENKPISTIVYKYRNNSISDHSVIQELSNSDELFQDVLHKIRHFQPRTLVNILIWISSSFKSIINSDWNGDTVSQRMQCPILESYLSAPEKWIIHNPNLHTEPCGQSDWILKWLFWWILICLWCCRQKMIVKCICMMQRVLQSSCNWIWTFGKTRSASYTLTMAMDF